MDFMRKRRGSSGTHTETQRSLDGDLPAHGPRGTRRPRGAQRMKRIGTDSTSTREGPTGADEDRRKERKPEWGHGRQGSRCFRKQEEQELLDYQTRQELQDLWVSGLGDGSE